MQTHLLVYDQHSGYEGVRELNRLFEAGWETLQPLKWFGCCGIYATVLYLPTHAHEL